MGEGVGGDSFSLSAYEHSLLWAEARTPAELGWDREDGRPAGWGADTRPGEEWRAAAGGGDRDSVYLYYLTVFSPDVSNIQVH